MQTASALDKPVATEEAISRLESITNRLVSNEALRLGVEVRIVSHVHGLLYLTYNGRGALVRQMRVPLSSGLLSYIADYKGCTYELLSHFGYSVPQTVTVVVPRSHGAPIERAALVPAMEAAREAAKRVGFPLVVKPDAEAQGNGVVAGVRTEEELDNAMLIAARNARKSNKILIQTFVEGEDYRFLIIDFKVFAVARRVPAFVDGDGELTIEQLVEKENERPERGPGQFQPLKHILIDDDVLLYLQHSKGYTMASVPAAGERVFLRSTANLSVGGITEDCTARVHSANLALLEHMARDIDTFITGIDVRCLSIEAPWGPEDYSVIEINTSPGIRMHHFPTLGRPRNAAGAMLRLLFPELPPLKMADGTTIGGEQAGGGIAEPLGFTPLPLAHREDSTGRAHIIHAPTGASIVDMLGQHVLRTEPGSEDASPAAGAGASGAAAAGGKDVFDASIALPTFTTSTAHHPVASASGSGAGASGAEDTMSPSVASPAVPSLAIRGMSLSSRRMTSEPRAAPLPPGTPREDEAARAQAYTATGAGEEDEEDEYARVVTSGIPAIPERVRTSLQRFSHARYARLSSWRSDGKGLTVLTRFGDSDQAHVVEVPGGCRRQLSFLDNPITEWQQCPPPYSAWHMFTMDNAGLEAFQLYVFDERTGQSRMLSDGRSRNGGITFTKSGDRVAFYSTARNGVDWDVMVAPTGNLSEARVLFPAVGCWQPIAWSPDGSALLVRHFRSITDSALYLVNADTGVRVPLLPEDRSTRGQSVRVGYGPARFAPDGGGVFFVSDEGTEHRTLRYIDVRPTPAYVPPTPAEMPAGMDTPLPVTPEEAGEAGHAGVLSTLVHITTPGLTKLGHELPWSVEHLDIAADGSFLAFVANVDGVSHLYSLPIPYEATGCFSWLEAATGGRAYCGPLRRIRVHPEGVIRHMVCRPAGHEVAYDLDSTLSPGDVYSADLDNGRVAQWTVSEIGPLAVSRFVRPRLVRVPSFDDLQLPSFLYMPRAVARPAAGYPVVIYFHGGPAQQYRPTFLPANHALSFQHLLAQGVAVFAVNVRGSSGYGKSFLDSDNGMKRSDAIRDIGAVLDWVAANEELDHDRVCVMGRSYGGFMVLAGLIEFSHRIKCGVETCGVTDFVTFLETTAPYRRALRRLEYGDERDEEMRDFLHSISPHRLAHRIKRPLFIGQGSNDTRVPLSEFLQIAQAVRTNNRPVWSFLAVGEGHVFRRKAIQDTHAQAMALFLERYLLDKQPTRRRRTLKETV